MKWHLKTFDSLTTIQLYQLLRLRSEVFVVEQGCAYGDLDGLDHHPQCYHLMGFDDAAIAPAAGASVEAPLVAYARLLPCGLAYADASSIGRVVVNPDHRAAGYGHALMREAIGAIQQLWAGVDIKIGAQSHLESFYVQHGFKVIGAPYDEDGIAHVPMQLNSD